MGARRTLSVRLQTLFSAHKSVDPKSFSFWEDVAELVVTKTTEDCREKWFSLAQTPTTKSAPTKTKQAQSRSLNDIAFEDDIFNATPMRGMADVFACDEQHREKDGSKGMVKSPIERNEATSNTETMAAGIQPKGYKMYIQKMGQCVRRKDPKAKKGRKKDAKLNRYFSEWDGEGDVEVNGRLSPGGTLRLNTHGNEDDEDFLNYYDCGDGEEMDEEMDEDMEEEMDPPTDAPVAPPTDSAAPSAMLMGVSALAVSAASFLLM